MTLPALANITFDLVIKVYRLATQTQRHASPDAMLANHDAHAGFAAAHWLGDNLLTISHLLSPICYLLSAIS